MCARTAIPCRIDRMPSRDGNSAGGLGSLDFGLQRTLPDIDFPPPRPPLSPLHFGPRLLLSLSFSLTLSHRRSSPSSSLLSRRGLSYPSDSSVPLSLLFPSPDHSPLPPLPLPFGASARPSGDQFGATERNVSRPGEIYSATQRTRTRIILFSPCTQRF